MKTKYITVFSLALILASCGETTKEKEVVTEETTTTASSSMMDYNIPSPGEQFGLFAKTDAVKNKAAVNPVSNATLYANSDAKALNFGVYSADLGYLTAFGDGSDGMSLYGKLEKLGADIGVAQVFSKEMGEMAKKYGSKPDSLFMLSSDVYNNTFSRMLEVDKGNELSLMLIGGWIESMHLMFNSGADMKKTPKLVKFIADQKVIGENLMGFLLEYEENATVKMYAQEIGAILTIYEKMNCTSTDSKVTKDGNKMVLSGGTTCEMTDVCLNELKAKVTEIRSKITKP